MSDARETQGTGNTRAPTWLLVFRDVQFWIPVAVLAGGVVVLAWIH